MPVGPWMSGMWLCSLPPGVLAWWRMVTDVRPAACRCTAGRACPEQVHRSGGQIQESTLAFCSPPATETWAGCWCSVHGLRLELLRRRASGTSHQAERWWNLQEVYSISTGHCFLQWWKQLGCLPSRSLWIAIIPTVWLLLVPLAFLPFFSPCLSLYVSDVVVWVGWNWSGTTVQSPFQKLSKLIAHPILSFPSRELFLAWQIPFGTEQWQLGEWVNAGKMKLSSYSFCIVCLWFFSLCCWSFLNRLQSSPRAVFIHEKLSNHWSL